MRKDQAESSALFELISSRYEHRSMLITANQPFGEWGSIFPDQAMTLAAVDRLVHRATIFEMIVESYRRRTAVASAKPRGRSSKHATPANTEVAPKLRTHRQRTTGKQPHEAPAHLHPNRALQTSVAALATDAATTSRNRDTVSS